MSDKAFKSVWDAIEDDPAQAANMRSLRVDGLRLRESEAERVARRARSRK
jgi:predicted XRE-type DNA-binding protein